jgi:uncharacterized protein
VPLLEQALDTICYHAPPCPGICLVPRMHVDYQLTQLLLDTAAPDLGPALLHGTVTGYLCSGALLDQDILPDLLQCPIPPVVVNLAERLAAETREDLQDTDFGFHPLLPADDFALAGRIEALGAWCDGFNTGFAAGYLRPGGEMSADMLEILNDFSQLADADAIVAEPGEQDEANFMELVEYVRMAAISLFQQHDLSAT